MHIIQIAPEAGSGRHLTQSQSHRQECWMEGWIALPQALIQKVEDCGGCCDLVIEEGLLTDVIQKEQPEQVREPSPEEDTEAMLVDHEYRLTLLELGVI